MKIFNFLESCMSNYIENYENMLFLKFDKPSVFNFFVFLQQKSYDSPPAEFQRFCGPLCGPLQKFLLLRIGPTFDVSNFAEFQQTDLLNFSKFFQEGNVRDFPFGGSTERFPKLKNLLNG
jgi:hypothetical protein